MSEVAVSDGSPPGGNESPQPPERRWRRYRPRLFSSATDAPRSRRPTDVVLLALAVLGVAILSIPAPGPTKLDTSITNLLKDVPGLLGWFWEICYDLLIGWAIVLLLVALFARGRKRLFLYLLLAANHLHSSRSDGSRSARS